MRQPQSKSAKHRMVQNVPTAGREETIADIQQKLSKGTFATVDYIYVLDQNQRLKGVFSVKELFLRPQNTKVKEIMKTNLIKARQEDEQEKVSILALKNNLKAIPLVDKENKFLGMVPSDAILGILHSEHIEDILKSVGIHSPIRETLDGTAIFLAKARIPWLVLGLSGGLVAAALIELFEAPLRGHFILAAFIPLMVYMADAVGAQTQTLFIRNLVLENRANLRRHILKEAKSGLVIALFLIPLLTLFSIIWFKTSYIVSLVLGTSLLLTILGAMLIGLIVPWLLWKFKKDPAIGAGPLGTIVRDLLSLVIYLLAASLIFWLIK